MALEQRKKKTYYYYKQRINGRVVTTYIKDPARIAALTQQRVQRAQQKRDQAANSRALRERVEQIESPFAELDLFVSALTRASLLLRGCRTHKGQWRHKRVQTNS